MKKLEIEEMGRITASEYKVSSKLPVTVILDNVRSLHNVGAVFRTCDAFRIERIILCGITATPLTSPVEIHKTALGAELTVDWIYSESCLDSVMSLKSQGYLAVALEQVHDSVKLQNFTADTGKKYALILGNEVKGVNQAVVDICDFYLEIPQFGTKHSLNVSVSGGIAIWELCKPFLQLL